MKKLLFLLFLGCSFLSYAQNAKITGTVKGANDNDPLIGVYVVEKGTTNGTSTDVDGLYSINAPVGSILQFSFIGYKTQELVVRLGTTLDVYLEPDELSLDEVVVIGYGTQKKSVVTAAIAKVSEDELKNVAPVRVDDALKGLAAGVTVFSASGQPGSSPQVRIRGIGTINDSDPLYIVDGMPIDGGIDYLNPSDIESIEILKDAASGAVYGARAANGVVLVTTRSGKQGRVMVTYDFNRGFQNPWKELSVLNATQYAVMMNEGYLNEGKAPIYADPYSLGEGTNWQKEIFNYNAPEQTHQFSLSGGTERVNYYVSFGYFNQEGIVGGNYDRSNYERMTVRSNTTYKLIDAGQTRNFFHKMDLGINVAYSRTNSTGITTNSEFGGPLGSALAMAPTLNVYTDNTEALLREHPTAIVDPTNGKAFSIVDGAIYNEMKNPLAMLNMPGSKGNSDKFVTNFWMDFNIWDNIKLRSTFGSDLSFWGDSWWTPAYYLSSKESRDYSDAGASMNRSFVWQWENILSYDKTFGKHTIGVMLGQSMQSNMGQSIGGSNKYLQEEDPYRAGIWFTTGTQADQSAWGSMYSPHRLSSVLGRISYDYDQRYMILATVRRDGSSNFGPNHKYATFPSVSIGWNFGNESFIKDHTNWLTLGKLRASWGKNGNESIGQYRYTTTINSGNNYPFGTDPSVITNGAKPNGFANVDLMWEESTQVDVGVDLGFIKNSLTLSADWYLKRTSGMLMNMPIPSYAGDSAPIGNVGVMDNSGIELAASYKLQVGDFYFGLGGNFTYLENTLIELGNENGWANYDSHKIGTLTRGQNGYPFPYFYGWKTDGVFQNWDEVKAYTNQAGGLIQPKAKPGDVRFKDLDGDGAITDEDRDMLGKGMPDFTYGFNLNLNWRGIDLSAVFQGVYGVQAFNVSRRTDLYYINLPSYMLDRWTGEGTSNKYPRFTMATDANENWRSSDLWVEDASYFRLKNLQIGYTFPAKWTKKAFISSFRLYVQATNLITLTKYTGFDPEIASGGTSLGIDRGAYPQSKVYSFGLNLSF